MPHVPKSLARLTTAAALLAAATAAQSVPVQVMVTIKNLAPTNSVTAAPLHLAFNNGSFDAFNIGQVATG